MRPNLDRLLSELRHHRVIRVAIAYLVGSWVAIEVADTLFPHLGLSERAVGVLVLVLIVGFPIAIALAWAFDVTPEVRRAKRDSTDSRKAAPAKLAGVAALLLVLMAGGWLAFRERPPTAAHAEVIAVAPFRIAGADPALAYLREGMLDLLAAKLTGDVGPRAVDPRTLVTAWRREGGLAEVELSTDDAAALALRLGAGRLLLGEVVGGPADLTITAAVVDAQTGEVLHRHAVSGRQEELSTLVDQTAAGLLLSGVEEERTRLSSLTSASLPALRSYLRGAAAYRQGRYEAAADLFQDALDQDSTFALAAFALWNAGGWFSATPQQRAFALDIAWRQRDRLGRLDRLLLQARVGPRYPDPSTVAEQLDLWREAAALMPDAVEARYWHADAYFHFGQSVGMEDAMQRALDGFERVLDLDPEFLPALQHAAQAALVLGDTAALRHHAERALALESAAEPAASIRWWLAAGTGDTASHRALRHEFGQLSDQNRYRIAQTAIIIGAEPLDAERVMVPHLSLGHRAAVAFNLGRPLVGPPPVDPGMGRYRILQSLYGDAPPAEAARLVEALRQENSARTADVVDRCAVEQWRVLQEGAVVHPGDFEAVEGPAAVATARLCALLLDALAAARSGRAASTEAVAKLDRHLRAGPPVHPLLWEAANLACARLYEALGQHERALAAVRRRPNFFGPPYLWAPSLRDEGRLAATVGDREGAIRAYRHYLALRDGAQGPYRAELERVRKEFAALLQEG